MNDDELNQAVQDELGYDVYHLYPDAKRLIPPEVLWALAGACVGEFLKGLIPLEALGQALRETLLELLRRFRTRNDLEGYVLRLNVREPVTAALDAARRQVAARQPSPAEVARATEHLCRALVEFGQKEGAAREHASKIAHLVMQSLQDPR